MIECIGESVADGALYKTNDYKCSICGKEGKEWMFERNILCVCSVPEHPKLDQSNLNDYLRDVFIISQQLAIRCDGCKFLNIKEFYNTIEGIGNGKPAVEHYEQWCEKEKIITSSFRTNGCCMMGYKELKKPLSDFDKALLLPRHKYNKW